MNPKKKLTVKGELHIWNEYDDYGMEIITSKGKDFLTDQKFNLSDYLSGLNEKNVKITIEVIE